MLGANVIRSGPSNGGAAVSFRMNDGSNRTIEADHVIAATGFRVDMRQLRFMSLALMERLRCADQTPVLSPHFETSVPGLFIVGVAAGNSFGPLLRFAYGAGFASRRLSVFLCRNAPARPVSVQAEMAPA
jgi:thioredoxin reductase